MFNQYMVGFFLENEEKLKVKDTLNKVLGLDKECFPQIDITTGIFVDLVRQNNAFPASKIRESISKILNRPISIIKIDVDDIMMRSSKNF